MSGLINKGQGNTDLARTTNPHTLLTCPDLRRLYKHLQAVGCNVMHYLLIYELSLLEMNADKATNLFVCVLKTKLPKEGTVLLH
jgi:hypothetical protein